jgi:hypothetical protein
LTVDPFDELIYGALRLVRPLVGSAKSLANDVIIGQNNLNSPSKNVFFLFFNKKNFFLKLKEKQKLSSSRLREIGILGIGQINEELLRLENNNGNEDNLPKICQVFFLILFLILKKNQFKGNSRICKFISCAAHNFKNDNNFANIQLIAQLLSDPKMRKLIGS